MPPPPCRICGALRHEIHCPMISLVRQAEDDKKKGQKEKELVRVKDLESILTFPPCPSNSCENRGCINAVLTMIGKCQKTDGDEVYQYGMKCLTATNEQQLLEDDPFPRLRRAIDGALLKSTKGKGQFGLMFQTLTEEARCLTGDMPHGRVMLFRVFRKFDLGSDRRGQLGERNLLNVEMHGEGVDALEDFRDKYNFESSDPRC